jgi:hypothetical protein
VVLLVDRTGVGTVGTVVVVVDDVVVAVVVFRCCFVFVKVIVQRGGLNWANRARGNHFPIPFCVESIPSSALRGAVMMMYYYY